MKELSGPVASSCDLRDMLRRHCVTRSLECMGKAAVRRKNAANPNEFGKYRQDIKNAVQAFYGTLPAGKNATPPNARLISSFDKDGYRIENVLFDSFPGWEVNATVYVPTNYKPPFPAVIVPVGHSGKQMKNYQLPCQYFTRNGFLVITFDPPGQASEKQPGNDHFRDGVRCYLTGETSSQYFIADALRCIDYLETRSDVNSSIGVAMTGVSGGGTTTTFAGLLDDRIKVTGPSCCVTSLEDLDISQCYAGCPETHMFRRYAEGIDEIDLLCAGAPKPTLLMAGEFDEVFHVEDTRKLADVVAEFYKSLNANYKFRLFVDNAGHCYSLKQAEEFVKFMNRWLLNEPDRKVPEVPESAFVMNPYEELQCRPRTDVNMKSLTLAKARELEKHRKKGPEEIRSAAAKIVNCNADWRVPEAKTGKQFQSFVHNYQQIMLVPEKGIELPSTFLYPLKTPAATILHFDDAGRNRLLCRHGLLAQSARFLDRENKTFGVFSVDLRGWGDSAPAMYPYEITSWGSSDRCLAYMSAALGDHVMSMRIRDALAALAYLRTRSEVGNEKIILSGCGLGGIVALHAASIDGNVQGVAVWDSLASFRILLEAEQYVWPADAFMPMVLKHYDLPELAASLKCPVKIRNPLDGDRKVLCLHAVEKLNPVPERHIYEIIPDNSFIVKILQSMLEESASK